ncbi:MAG: hypothetical protein ACLFUH_07465 [Bacteroidales bacterium]
MLKKKPFIFLFTLLFLSSLISAQSVKVIRNETIDTNSTNWTNLEWNYEDIDYNDRFELINDTYLVSNISGVYRITGTTHPFNSAGSSKIMKIGTRVLVDGRETKGTEAVSYKTRASKEFNTLHFTGIINVKKGEKIKLQYKVDDTDLDIKSDDIFDENVVASMSLNKINIDYNKFAIPFGFALFALIFVYLTMHMKNKSPLRWLFFFGTLIFILSGTFTMLGYANITGFPKGAINNSMYFIIIVIILSLAFFLINFITNLVEKIDLWKKKNK